MRAANAETEPQALGVSNIERLMFVTKSTDQYVNLFAAAG
jgi:hypothetical protein